MDANAELDQRVQLLELQMIEIMKDRASSAAQAASAKEQPDGTNSDETVDVHGERTDFWPRAKSPRQSGRKHHCPPINSCKDDNSEDLYLMIVG